MSTVKSPLLSAAKLAWIIVLISVVCGGFLLLDLRTPGFVWQLRLAVLGAGPLVCLFLVGMLFVAFFRASRRPLISLLIGTCVGLATFAVYFYALAR